MEDKEKSCEDLEIIRKVMEKSTRFLSLSGISGVFMGLIALSGSAVAFFLIMKGQTDPDYFSGLSPEDKSTLQRGLFMDAAVVLILAVLSSVIFSYRKALRLGQRIWTPVTRRLLLSVLVPLVTGGLFMMVLFYNSLPGFIIPAMLIFYGLALINAEKFTFTELFYLGILEIILGLMAAVFPEAGIFLWSIGFGVLHIIYGLVMYRKYER